MHTIFPWRDIYGKKLEPLNLHKRHCLLALANKFSSLTLILYLHYKNIIWLIECASKNAYMTTGTEHEQLFILISWKNQGVGTPEDQLVRLNQPVGAVLE